MHDPIEAESLVYTSILFAITPLWLLYPAFFSCSNHTRQLLIASYRASPMILAACQPLVAAALRRLRDGRGSSLLSGRSDTLTRISLYIAAAGSATGHLYAIATAILSSSASLATVFFPWAELAETSLGSPGSVLQRGCHLFLQNDLIVIIAALVPFAATIFGLKRRRPQKEDQETGWFSTWSRRFASLTIVQRLSALSGLAIVASPGAVISLSLASSI